MLCLFGLVNVVPHGCGALDSGSGLQPTGVMAPGRVPTFDAGLRWIREGLARIRGYHTVYLGEYYNFGFCVEKKNSISA